MGWGVRGQRERFCSCTPGTSSGVLEGTPRGEGGAWLEGLGAGPLYLVHRSVSSSK